MKLVKVLWQHRGVDEATWEARTLYVPIILSYLKIKVCF